MISSPIRGLLLCEHLYTLICISQRGYSVLLFIGYDGSGPVNHNKLALVMMSLYTYITFQRKSDRNRMCFMKQCEITTKSRMYAANNLYVLMKVGR
jgi:hypothetical protein